jgi:hypothetical protein
MQTYADPDELVRRITGLIELDAKLPLGALSAKGRGGRGLIFGRYFAAHLLVTRFNVQVEDAAKLLNRDRSTVTKALKVFRFLEGYTGWRKALDTFAEMSEKFVAFGHERAVAAEAIPAPVGRDRKNDALPLWVRERYAVEIEAQGDADAAHEARAQAEADSIYLRHPAVKAITDDPDLVTLIGVPVVSVTLSPLDDPHLRRPMLLVPPSDKTGGAIALRLLVKGDSLAEIKTMLAARAAASRALLRKGFRLTGVAETFASRDKEGWRYIPLHIAQMR